MIHAFLALQASVYYLSEYTQFKSIVDKLIEGNVDLSISYPGPILYICLQYNKVDFAKYLLSVGSSVEQRTVFGQSCFYKGKYKLASQLNGPPRFITCDS